MRARTRMAAVVATLSTLTLAGCEGEPAGSPTGTPTGAEPVLPVERPHFTGSRTVSLAVGLRSYSDDGCRDDGAPAWACDPAADRGYRTMGEPRPARLVEARMDVADGGTSWTVTVRFDRAGRRDLIGARKEAQASGAVVLVLDSAGEVVLPATVLDIEGGAIRIEELTKPEAWDTVEEIAEE